MKDDEYDVLVFASTIKTRYGFLEVWRSSKEKNPNLIFKAQRILRDETGKIVNIEYTENYIPLQLFNGVQ